jgi:hypothetical protein
MHVSSPWVTPLASTGGLGVHPTDVLPCADSRVGNLAGFRATHGGSREALHGARQ